jgi:hypothetical protein
LRRIFNLVDPNVLKQYLKVLALLFWAIKDLFKAIYSFSIFEPCKIPFHKKRFYCSLNPLYLLAY